MPRNLRIDYAGARHHLFNRARQPAELFRDDDDCIEFLSLVAELPERFGVQVHAWCLMPTHYHLLVRSMRGQLSGAAQFLQSQHARLFNRRRKMAGPLFRGRFGSRLVEDDPYWLYLVGYIHLNPVKDRLCASPDQARWSSHGVYIGRDRAPEWMTAGDLRQDFGDIGGYRAYIQDLMTKLEDLPDGQDPPEQAPLRQATIAPQGGHVDPARPLDPERALTQVAAVCERSVAEVMAARRGVANPARWVAMWWLHEAAGMRNRELAEQFRTSPAQVSTGLGRARGASSGPMREWKDRLALGWPESAGRSKKITSGTRTQGRGQVWQPFTQHEEWEADGPAVVIERAEGCWLIDTEGRRYLDGVASLWTNVHGHRHPHIDGAIRAQLDRVAHSTLLGLGGQQANTLAERLVELTDRLLPWAGLTHVFYSDSGSTAVEVALKMAFQWQQQRGETGRIRFAALDQAYHGDTIGSVSVGGIDLFHSIYRPMLFEALRLPCPERAEPADEARCLAQAEALLAQHGPSLAAIVVEPLVQGAAGMRMHSPDFLRRLLSLARAQGALVIVDEVATGFGRTGRMFASQALGSLSPSALPQGGPDLLCLAKGLSGGYLPIAATMAARHVFDGFRGPPGSTRTFFHGHTYTGNALACAAAIASLEVFVTDRVIEGLPPKIDALREAMAALPDRFVAERRQHGLMAGVLLKHDRPLQARTAHRVCLAARGHGVIVRPLGDLVVLMPPLAMSPQELRATVEAVGKGIEEVLGAPEASVG